MKNKISLLIMVVIIIVVGVFAIKQTQENKRYEEYLSLQVFNDYSKLAFKILQNQQYYEEILETGSITAEQLRFLIENNADIKMITEDYRYFAIDLHRIDGEKVSNLASNNAASIGIYFHSLSSHYAEELGVYNEETYELMPVDLLGNKSFELEDELLESITMIRDLNQEWANVVVENIDGVYENHKFDYSAYTDTYFEETIEKDFWVDVNVKMEKATESFIREHNIVNDIGTLLNNSPI